MYSSGMEEEEEEGVLAEWSMSEVDVREGGGVVVIGGGEVVRLRRSISFFSFADGKWWCVRTGPC